MVMSFFLNPIIISKMVHISVRRRIAEGVKPDCQADRGSC